MQVSCAGLGQIASEKLGCPNAENRKTVRNEKIADLLTGLGIRGRPVGEKVFIPLLKRAQAGSGLPSAIVIADAGLLSGKNIEAFVEYGYEYILGARIRNENTVVKRRILALNFRLYTILFCHSNGLFPV